MSLHTASQATHTRAHTHKQDCYMLYANKCKVEAISISFCATHKHADMYKTPHSQRLSQPAPPPSSRKTSTLLNQVPASCHREATGDAPLSLGAESHPRSSSLILPLSPARPPSLCSCLSGSRSCRWCVARLLRRCSPCCFNWGS